MGFALFQPDVLRAQTLVYLDFETASSFSNNFRFTYNSATTTTAQTSNGVANDYVATASGVSVENEFFVYDTTPADGTVKNSFSGPVKVEADIRAGTATGSFGLALINPSNEGGAVHQLALFNWDVTGVNDRLRIFFNNTVTGTTVGTSAYDSGASGTVNSGANAGNSAFTHLILTYRADTVDVTKAVLNLTVGTMTSGDIVLGAGTYLSSYEIGLRSFDPTNAAGTIDFDNFTVTQIPEPSSYALLGLGLGVIWFVRRKKSL